MKIKNLLTASLLKSRFNGHLIVALLLFICGTTTAQTEKVFEKEYTTNEQVHIVSNVPTDFNLHMDGRFICDNTKDRYILTGKNETAIVNISKELNIHTWEKDVIRQEVKVVADIEDNALAKEFLNSIKIDLKKSANGQIAIDCNMNIKSIYLKNSFFGGDQCTVVLDNGKKIDVKGLLLETTLYIPKNANLTVEGSRNCTIMLDDIDGDVEFNLSYAEVYGKTANKVKANLNYCYNFIFDQITSAEINAINSGINIKSSDFLEIGKNKLPNRCVARSLQNKIKSNAFQNIFHFTEANEIIIFQSANDEYSIGKVKKMKINNAAFSQIQVDYVDKTFNLRAKNSDVTISKVNKDFKELNLNNTLGSISVNVEEGASYYLSIPKDNYTEYKLNRNFKSVESNNSSEQSFQVGNGEAKGMIYINCDRCKFDIS